MSEETIIMAVILGFMLWLLVVNVVGAVGAVRVGATASAAPAAAFKQRLVFVDLLPRHLADVVGEPGLELSKLGSQPDDSIGYETLHDAVLEAQRLGSSLAFYVPAENILFIFGQRTKALCDAQALLPVAAHPREPVENGLGHHGKLGGQRGEKPHPQSRAMVFCKLRHPESFAQLLAAQDDGCEKEHGEKADYSLLTWGELDKLKHRLDERIAHDRASKGASNA